MFKRISRPYKSLMFGGLTLALLAVTGACQKEEEGPQIRTLKVWQTESDPAAQKVLSRISADFEKTRPGLSIEIESISWGALSQKLTAALATGDTPDIVHLQPFMAASLYEKGLLEPIDDVIEAIGRDDIYESVRDLQLFDGKHYGIAYAIGTTYYSYRKDWATEKALRVPKTWKEYIDFVAAMTEDLDGDGAIDRYGVILPGGSPFFVDQLTAELVASNGGRLFDGDGRPTFTEEPVLETLKFWMELVKYAPPDWTSEGYVDQFRSMAIGKGATVPVTYARASKQIAQDAAAEIANPAHFAVMPQPTGPSGSQGYATIDCEPYAILANSRAKDDAKEFLKFFFSPPNYLEYTRQVPIHLTPILRSVAEAPEYLTGDFIEQWEPWQEASLQVIRAGHVRPIMLAEDDDRTLPFLLELQGSRVITDMVLAVTNDGKSPEQAAAEAQNKAEELIENLGYKDW